MNVVMFQRKSGGNTGSIGFVLAPVPLLCAASLWLTTLASPDVVPDEATGPRIPLSRLTVPAPLKEGETESVREYTIPEGSDLAKFLNELNRKPMLVQPRAHGR